MVGTDRLGDSLLATSSTPVACFVAWRSAELVMLRIFSSNPTIYPYIYPLVICYIAIEAMAIEIVKTWLEMVIFHSYVNVYQRVYITALDCGAKLTLTLESFFSFPCFNMLRNIALDERPEVDPIFYIILSYSIYICVPLTNV